MLMQIPTYNVTFREDAGRTLTFRVPRNQLDSFLRVLVFNEMQDFHVVVEPGLPNTAGNAAQ